MDMCQNILLPSFKVEHTVPTYYLQPANIYGLDIHDASNKICSVYTWTGFEGNKGIKNTDSCLLLWINDKGYYSQSYGKKHKMPEIDLLVDNCGGQNKNNVMIQFLKIIKEQGLFETSTLYFYIKGPTKNYCDRSFNSLVVL